ncbi:MAG TPA: hypothetical protein VK565_08105 [Gemmatimonadaceae bacterium]|nr:hypothetical protein [Gemmatimonadaceae bacterium]
MQLEATRGSANSPYPVVFSKKIGWEQSMEIKFRHDVDNVLKEAREQNKPVILDFSAAPM